MTGTLFGWLASPLGNVIIFGGALIFLAVLGWKALMDMVIPPARDGYLTHDWPTDAGKVPRACRSCGTWSHTLAACERCKPNLWRR